MESTIFEIFHRKLYSPRSPLYIENTMTALKILKICFPSQKIRGINFDSLNFENTGSNNAAWNQLENPVSCALVMHLRAELPEGGCRVAMRQMPAFRLDNRGLMFIFYTF